MIMLLLLYLFQVPMVQAVDQRPSPEEEWVRVVDLRGTWQFSLGDDPTWADPEINDKVWEEVFVPARWEEEGFWGYDGYAWYRKRFRLPREDRGRSLYLDVGRIDDVSAVYVNGHFIGSAGRFPPEYKTAFHAFSRYRIPSEYLDKDGYNIVAIRVFDSGGEGGLLEGKPGIYANLDEPMLALDLAGPWAFRIGDRMRWRFEEAGDDKWEEIMVPGRWEPQGYAEYDGFAWYRKSFYLPASFKYEDLVLLLGKIDDLDEAYLNGTLIGATGRMADREIEGWEWQEVRAYPLPETALRYGAENVLAVRVYDGLLDGGIHEGPVGIANREDIQHWETHGHKKPRSAWKNLLEWLFQEEPRD